MIRVTVGTRSPRRATPSALLIGLILLVASHLVGALHGPGFLGPHSALTTAGASPPTAAAGPVAFESDHDHGHGHEVFEDTVEHAVDRVRTSSDHPLHAPQPVGPVVDRPVTGSAPERAGPAHGLPAPPGGRSACARHCIWRQ